MICVAGFAFFESTCLGMIVATWDFLFCVLFVDVCLGVVLCFVGGVVVVTISVYRRFG